MITWYQALAPVDKVAIIGAPIILILYVLGIVIMWRRNTR